MEVLHIRFRIKVFKESCSRNKITELHIMSYIFTIFFTQQIDSIPSKKITLLKQTRGSFKKAVKRDKKTCFDSFPSLAPERRDNK